MENFLGKFTGRGIWYEANGESGGYSVVHRIEQHQDGFLISFEHVFENGDPDTNARFEIKTVTPELFTLHMAGAQIGKGYAIGELCHYTAQFGDMIVEASMLSTATGLKIWGSSSSNRAGNATAWQEMLEKVAA